MKRVDLADWKATRYQKRLVKKVLNSGRLTYGNMTRKLEDGFADVHNHGYALFTSSGTAALKIALHALKDRGDWKDGDEVIIPAVTFVATMNVVIMNRLKPVLVDINSDTVNINPELIEAAITPKTRAIIAVHLLGQPAEMDKIMAIAKKHNLKVIEDSCETMFVPSEPKGDITCYSTYLAHLMVTGIGGFICTDDGYLAKVMRSMMFHGRDDSYLNIDDNPTDIARRFYFPRFGYSDRMTEMEAAIGLGDLKNWKQMIEKRQENARYLTKGLISINGIWGPIADHSKHAFMFYPMYSKERDQLTEYLESQGIMTRHMMPLTTQPIVKKYIKGDLAKKFPKANFVNETGFLIGCHQYLTKNDLDRVIKAVKDFYENLDA